MAEELSRVAHTHFPNLGPPRKEERMKKHSARVAPLSSYSTQVLTCPISEGKTSCVWKFAKADNKSKWLNNVILIKKKGL